MTYSVEDLTELIRHNLIFSEIDPDRSFRNLAQLTANIDQLMHEPLTSEGGWVACESCGAWVGTELIGSNGAGYTMDGAFNCASCRWNCLEE